MVDTQLTHQTYKFVKEEEADAFAWVFLDHENMKKVPFKFPELKNTELRARVTYTGLCHSDVHTVRDEWGKVAHPIAPGHEIVGEVTHIGSDVTEFKVGDKVGFGAQRDCCDECEFCKLSFDQHCTGEVDQKFTYGGKYWGGYASAVQHPAKFFFKIPDNLPEEKIPPLFCAGATTYAPIARHAKPGDEVGILGIGGLGHLAVKYAKAWGCKVTAFTSSKDKEAFIKELGADRVVVLNKETLKEEAGKYHLIINTLPDGSNFSAWVSLCRPLGTFCQLGLPPVDKSPTLNVFTLMARVSIVGSLIGSRKEIKEMLEFSGKHNIVPLCEQFDFEEFPQAYDRLVNGKPIFRCVVDATKAHPHHHQH